MSIYVSAMTGLDVQNFRRSAGLTQTQFAALLGVSTGAVSRWESSDRCIPESMSRYIRLLRANGWKHADEPARQHALSA